MKKKEIDLFNILLGLVIGCLIGFFIFTQVKTNENDTIAPTNKEEVYGTVYIIQLGASAKVEDLESGVYVPHTVGGEWVSTDGINSFLDEGGEANGYSVRMLLKDDEDQYVDMGILPSYEHGMLLALLTRSKYKDDHIAFARAFLDTVSERKEV